MGSTAHHGSDDRKGCFVAIPKFIWQLSACSLCRVMTPCVSSTSCHTCYHILPTFAGALQTLAIQCVQNSDPSSLRAKTSSRLTPFTQRATAEGDREGS